MYLLFLNDSNLSKKELLFKFSKYLFLSKSKFCPKQKKNLSGEHEPS